MRSKDTWFRRLLHRLGIYTRADLWTYNMELLTLLEQIRDDLEAELSKELFCPNCGKVFRYSTDEKVPVHDAH